MKSLIKRLVPKGMRNKLKGMAPGNSGGQAVAVPYTIQVSTPGLLKGKVAIVTGGSGAIGRAICCRLAADGALVVVCGMSHDKMQGVVDEIGANGGKAVKRQLDISSEEKIIEFYQWLKESYGQLDILVNCAGGSARQASRPIYELETETIDTTLHVNLRGAILVTREASKIMVAAKRGTIVSVTSVIGEHGKAKFSEYAAAKAGIIAFTKSIAMELGKLGITANCVSPGIVQRGTITPAQMAKLKKTNYMNDYGRPEDISEMVAYLTREEGKFITGQNFKVDGGRSLGLKGD